MAGERAALPPPQRLTGAVPALWHLSHLTLLMTETEDQRRQTASQDHTATKEVGIPALEPPACTATAGLQGAEAVPTCGQRRVDLGPTLTEGIKLRRSRAVLNATVHKVTVLCV